MAIEVREIISEADICLECGGLSGFHEKTCLVYVLQLEEYRDHLENVLYRIHSGEVGGIGYAD